MTAPATTARFWRLPASLPEDLGKFQNMTRQFKDGAISATQYQVFRVPQGVYEQRENGTYMLRVRLPAGVVLPHQMRKLADVATKYGNGILHVTTRQDVQVHQVLVDAIHPALVELAESGLSTKGGGGNTVRNVTGCPHAGICGKEAFDVTPHAIGLTEFLLNDPNSFQMPRKYKIAFSGCAQDCAAATVHDLGLIAKVRDGVEGFAVYVAGGLGSASRVAELLEEFVPAADVPPIAEAVKRVFYQHGNRKDKRQARLRFLFRQLGREKFVELYRQELSAVLKKNLPWPELRPISSPPGTTPVSDASVTGETEAYRRWFSTHVTEQKQRGFYRIEIPLLLGDIPSAKLSALAAVVESYGERSLRATPAQNLVLRWARESELAEIYNALNALGLAGDQPTVLQKLVVCTGASTCKLGICLSRGVAGGIGNRLQRSNLNLDALGDLSIHVSGCPNSCGRHPIASIGLHGAARRIDERLVPHYILQVGGHVKEGETILATGHHSIPARNVPTLIEDLLRAFGESSTPYDFRAFLRDGGEKVIDDLAARHKHVPGFDEDKNFYYDWGASELFSLAGRGPGECGAGVFDLIEVDLKSAGEALAGESYFKAAALAARALLVTRGEQAQNDRDAFLLFQKHFVEAGLADAKFTPLLECGVIAAGNSPTGSGFEVSPVAVADFVTSVQTLFKQMDASLQFPKKAETQSALEASSPSESGSSVAAPVSQVVEKIDLEKDFRGVVCPLNYVKTKMALGTLKKGQTLLVLLDEAGARNVPDSAAKDGNEIVSVAKYGDAFRLIIRKG